MFSRRLFPYSRGLFNGPRHSHGHSLIQGNAKVMFRVILLKAEVDVGRLQQISSSACSKRHTEEVGQVPLLGNTTQATSGSQSDHIKAHQFDTYKLVSALESAGYTQKQAVALMKCLRTVLVNGTEVAKIHYLSRGDLENVNLVYYSQLSSSGDISISCSHVRASYGGEKPQA